MQAIAKQRPAVVRQHPGNKGLTDKKYLDENLAKIKAAGMTPRLLLHCCCAPCSGYVLEYLSIYFKITAFFYNPNIEPREQYDRRADEMRKLLELAGYSGVVDLVFGDYEIERFLDATAQHRDEPEGGRRCDICFYLRLSETAKRAKENGYDYFATTLSVSPHKDAALLNDIGVKLAESYGIKYLQADFKKRDGYKRSIELSKQYGLYRQEYCGCYRSRLH